MTGCQLMERALTLLGYTNSYGDVSARQNTELLKRTVPVTNQILADVLFVMGQPARQIIKADDELPVSDDVAIRVMPWGVGMLIAQSENDGDNQQLMETMYQQARGSLPRAPERRQDVIPRPIL